MSLKLYQADVSTQQPVDCAGEQVHAGFPSSVHGTFTESIDLNLKSASNLNGNLNCSKELEHYAS